MKNLLTKRCCSFKYAFQGIARVLRTQPNFWIHLLAASIVFLGAMWLKISAIQWCLLVLSVSMVISAEVFNTAIEYLCDAVTKEQNEYIGAAKDVAAAAVLITSVFAAIVGIIIFMPYLAALCA
ncbi:MAG: diacylglycerol kinase family protein [Kiritimatiellae bacterium]|nr:diacylglycerol kinase family protein [Kiritimatiellia bacterium]